ncbi:hypothetical protein B0H63DRAFT_278975 [Podospora didyma]|uniref:Uncharacterized protein n=1 Tax=Podospora didyma TaxID=330526 RepID=A0AAE0KEP5_9PEZI|nr:hypothetical protein B0H63DRAFT_278975 [Podospora didyma]
MLGNKGATKSLVHRCSHPDSETQHSFIIYSVFWFVPRHLYTVASFAPNLETAICYVPTVHTVQYTAQQMWFRNTEHGVPKLQNTQPAGTSFLESRAQTNIYNYSTWLAPFFGLFPLPIALCAHYPATGPLVIKEERETTIRYLPTNLVVVCIGVSIPFIYQVYIQSEI